MKNSKKLFAVVLSALLAFSSVSALAAGPSLYLMGDPVILDGVKQQNSLGLFVSYDKDRVNLSSTSLTSYENLIDATGDFTINLSGKNTLKSTGEYAVKVVGNLTVKGDGTLTAEAKRAAIYVEGDVIIDGGATLTLTGTDEASYGIYSTGSLTVTDSEVVASGKTADTVFDGEPLPGILPDEEEKEDETPSVPDTEDNTEEDTEINTDTEENTDSEITNSAPQKPSVKPSGTSAGGAPAKLPSQEDAEDKKTDLVAAATSVFSDVSATDWFYEYVSSLTEKGIINGYPDKTFRPSAYVTYGEALKLVARAAGLPEQKPANGHWAGGYLNLAVLVGALPKDQNLDEYITRGTIASLSKLFLGLPAPKNPSPFADVDDAAITSLYEAGIVEGSFVNGQRVFLPDSPVTRAEISAIVYRMLAARS